MSDATWNIDLAHSAVHFSVRHMVFAKVRGSFKKWSGELRLDEQDLTRSSVKASVEVGSIDTGNEQRDGHLKSADFFEADAYPVMTFESARVERTGEGEYRVVGALTIRDVTREVALDVEYGGSGTDPWGQTKVGFAGKTSIDRREFGLKWNQALEAGGVLVGDKVDIEIEVQAVKVAQAQAASA